MPVSGRGASQTGLLRATVGRADVVVEVAVIGTIVLLCGDQPVILS